MQGSDRTGRLKVHYCPFLNRTWKPKNCHGDLCTQNPTFNLDNTEVRKYTTAELGPLRKEWTMQKKGPQSEMVAKRTKTTASIPADLYGQMWQLIANERIAGRRLTA